MGRHDTLLQSYNVLHTTALDEARAAVASRYCDHRLNMIRGRMAHVVHNHVRGSRMSLNVLGYGADVAINPGELQHFYLLQLPLEGHARITHRGEEVQANVACGTLLNPDRPSEMIWQRDCRKLMIQIDAEFLNHVAETEVGAPLPGPVRFDPKVVLTHDGGQRLLSLSLAAARAIDTGCIQPAHHDLTLLALERQLAVTVLDTQPSNVSHLLRSALPAATAPHLRRAVAYIHEQAHENITLHDIAFAAGIHHRTLQAAFRDTVGVTPIAYLRDVRLDKARFHLMRRQNRARVCEVAYDCGYSHLGRFSKDYRARFGHAPSETR
jgi:AraC-like DNA-binding protein